MSVSRDPALAIQQLDRRLEKVEARLAAPSLAAALRECVAKIEKCDMCQILDRDVLARARAALAAVEGE